MSRTTIAVGVVVAPPRSRASRLDRADDAVAWSEAVRKNQRRLSDDVLRSILASRWDPIAILDVASTLVVRWRKATNQASATNDEAVLRASIERDVLMTLVSCDLGNDCTSDGFQMKQMCALSMHYCGLDQRAWMFSELAPDDRLRLEAHASTMVDAIRNNDFAFWGL